MPKGGPLFHAREPLQRVPSAVGFCALRRPVANPPEAYPRSCAERPQSDDVARSARADLFPPFALKRILVATGDGWGYTDQEIGT
jgi:hypothetical protein